MTPHHCHAVGCTVVVPPRLLMCLRHWWQVPLHLRLEVWRNYRPRRGDNERPSAAWMTAAKAAIAAVYETEHPRAS